MRGSVVKRGNRYDITYRVAGKQKWEKAGSNKHQAEKILAERMGQVNRGEWQDVKEITFAQYADLWLTRYASGAVKISTMASYRSNINNHLLPAFGPMALTSITLEDCQDFVTRKRGAGLSPRTITHCVVILKGMLKHAVRWNYLRHNPAQYVEKPRIPYREMDFLDPAEVRCFLEAAKEVHPERYPLFLTAVFTGMRRGELLGMRWHNLDWRRRQYFVKEAYYRGRFEEPKSEKSRRAVNLAPALMNVLTAVYKEQEANRHKPEYQEADLVFCHGNGTPLDPDTVGTNEFHRVLKASGLHRIRFHDLRHTFAALLVAQGESPKYIQAQMGHSSIQVTLDRYGHLMPEVNEAAALRLETQVLGPSVSRLLAVTTHG